MQLIDTHVDNKNDGMITVEFQGEGGELVSVRMAASDVQAEGAIHRAKAMMVQLTSFAEDRHPSQDERSQSSDESEERGEGPSETKPALPVVSSFGDPPSSAA